LVGCGTVGSGLLELLDRRADYIAGKYGVSFKLLFATDTAKGTAFWKEGLDPRALLEILESGGSIDVFSPGGPKDLASLLEEAKPDIICEATPTNYETGEPGMSIMTEALASGANVVSCSKGALSRDMAGLKVLAVSKRLSLRFESSVMSGTPLLSLIRGPMAGCEISKIEGILNGTTNFILTKMEEGMDYGEALAEATRLGYAEANPEGDVEGFDAAVKVCILAAEIFGTPLRLEDVHRRGITRVQREDIERAAATREKIKLVAGVKKEGDSVIGYVSPEFVRLDNPLASVSGVTNAVSITTDNLGVVTVTGPGAGKIQTAQGLLSDMLSIAREQL